MPHSYDVKRRRREEDRAQFDDPHRPSLQERPTPAMRFRQLAAYCLRVPVSSLSEAHIDRFRQSLPVIRQALAGANRADARHSYLEYLDAYFLTETPITTAELGAEFGVSPTGVSGACNYIYRIAHETLLLHEPALVAEAQREIAVTDAAFWDRVEKRADGCWIWLGATDLGYGVLKRGGKKRQAHRYAYELVNGPVGEGMHVVHICRVRPCVNPAHLYEAAPGEISA